MGEEIKPESTGEYSVHFFGADTERTDKEWLKLNPPAPVTVHIGLLEAIRTCRRLREEKARAWVEKNGRIRYIPNDKYDWADYSQARERLKKCRLLNWWLEKKDLI